MNAFEFRARECLRLTMQPSLTGHGGFLLLFSHISLHLVSQLVARHHISQQRIQMSRTVFDRDDNKCIVDHHNELRRLEGAADMELMVNLLVFLWSYLTHWTPEDGIPTLRKLPYAPDWGIPSERLVAVRAGRRYTCDTVDSRSAPADRIQSLFSNAYWPQNSGVIEIQTRQLLKNNCFRETANFYDQILHLDT